MFCSKNIYKVNIKSSNKLLQPIPASKSPNKDNKKIKLRMKPREIIQGKLEIYRENKIILPLNKILRISQDTFTNSKSIAAEYNYI